jgi:hypothetical protein
MITSISLEVKNTFVEYIPISIKKCEYLQIVFVNIRFRTPVGLTHGMMLKERLLELALKEMPFRRYNPICNTASDQLLPA